MIRLIFLFGLLRSVWRFFRGRERSQLRGRR